MQVGGGGDGEAAGRQAGAFEAIFVGIPPDDFYRWQFELSAAIGHQGFALLTTADHAAVADLVGQLRLVRVAPQAIDFGGRQGRELRAGQSIGLEQQTARQRVADFAAVRLRAPGFRQAQRAGR
ncbi:hypothetical protein D3C71_1623680 [compost metagenome]